MTRSAWTMLLSGLLLTCAGGAGGCWAGRLADRDEFDAIHPAVRWVRRPGGQIGWFLWIPIADQHSFGTLWHGSNNTGVVQEWGSGCMLWTPLRPRYAVDVETGQLTVATPRERASPVHSDYEEAIGTITRPEGVDWLFWTSAGDRPGLHVGRPEQPRRDYTLLLRSAEGPAVSWPDDVIQPRPGVLIVACNHYLFRLDVERLPAAAGGPDTGGESQARSAGPRAVLRRKRPRSLPVAACWPAGRLLAGRDPGPENGPQSGRKLPHSSP